MRKLLAPVAIQDEKNVVRGVDTAAFVRRLLLFDTYILQSVWMEDLKLLSEIFTPAGLASLFQAGALKTYCESFAIGEFGRARADLNFSDNNKRLPLGSYSFSVVRVNNQQDKINQALEHLGPVLGVAAQENLVTIEPKEFSRQVFEGFYGDVRSNQGTVAAAVAQQLSKQGIKPKRLLTHVTEVEPEDFRVDSNLRSEYGLSEATAHRIVEKALMAVAGLNQVFVEMQTHQALSGITIDDLTLMNGKLRFAAEAVVSENADNRFERLARVVMLPLPTGSLTRVDAEKLLRLRESDECRAFRDWLAQTDSLSDQELNERVNGLRARLGAAFNGKWGNSIRFLVSNGVSVIPGVGTVVGLALSAVDKFILERLLHKDSVVSFLSESYPSLFKRGL